MTTFDNELKDARTALLGLVDVIERLIGQEPRTAEIRKRRREYLQAEKRAEVLTTAAECDKL